MKKAPKVLTRMRLSCCWGDNLNVKELNEIVDYINDLERYCKKQNEVIDKEIKYIKKNSKTNPNLSGLLIGSEIDTLLDILEEVLE